MTTGVGIDLGVHNISTSLSNGLLNQSVLIEKSNFANIKDNTIGSGIIMGE